MTFNAGNRKDVTRATKAAALADLNRREVLIRIVADESGRRWLWDLIADAHVFESLYSDDANRMYFLEGQRSQGLYLLDVWMQHAPDQFIQAMR